MNLKNKQSLKKLLSGPIKNKIILVFIMLHFFQKKKEKKKEKKKKQDIEQTYWNLYF